MTTQTPALDFLRKVQIWQEDEANKTAGLVVIMPESEQENLRTILASATRYGDRLMLEDLARRWLIGYRELETAQRVLDDGQRAELNDVISQDVAKRAGQRQQSRPRGWRSLPRAWQWTVIGAASLLIGFGLAGLAKALAGSSNGSPPAAGAPVNPGQAQPQPGPLTDLQQFRADWNVPASATADAGSPQALVLLQDGLYYPTPWTVPAGDAGWTTDSTGTVSAETITGPSAVITDQDGNQWAVAPGQPFAVASNPQLVFRVLRDGTIQSMPGPHAIVVRHRI